MTIKKRTRWVRWIACIALLHTVTAFAGLLEMPDTTEEAPDMEREPLLKDPESAPVSDSADPQAGPRLPIAELRVQGIIEYPDLGITRASLNRVVEGIRLDAMDEPATRDPSVARERRSERPDLEAKVEDQAEDEQAEQQLIFSIREHRREQGLTVGMIESIADAVTRFYRERGFILAKAYIPEQRVRDGVVTLTVLLGNLGDLDIHNNQRYKKSTIKNIFADALGDPVYTKTIEERLFLLNDMPGLSAQAYFEPGAQLGDTKLNINVVNEKIFQANVRVDNHGSSNTGEYRLYTDGYWYNPGGIGDQLHIGVLGTFEPSNSVYGSLHYGIPVFSPRTTLTFGGSTNDFVSKTLSQLELSGTSLVLDTTLNYAIKRSRVKNYSAEIRLAQIDSDIEASIGSGRDLSAIDELDLDTLVRNLDLVFHFDVLHENIRALHQGGVRLTYGDFAEGRAPLQNRNPLILAFNYSLLKFVKVPFRNAGSRVAFKLAGQYADSPVPSISQLPLAGPTRMRGFEINEYVADSGVYLGVDWSFKSPAFLDFEVAGENLSEILQPYVFADAAYGDTDPINPGQTGTWAVLSDIGFGLKAVYRNRVRLNASFARKVSYENDQGPSTTLTLNDLEDRNKVYIDAQYSF